MIVQLILVNFEGVKADWYTEPSRIQRLPGIGMVKVYPKCVLTAANIDQVVTLMQMSTGGNCMWAAMSSKAPP